MRKAICKTAIFAILALIIASASFAQGPGGPQSGPFAQFREEHKFTFQLSQMVRHIGEIDKDPKHALTPAQAKQVLAVLKPLRTQPKLTQDQAKQALKDLKRVFTVDQLNAMAKIKSPQRRPGMGGPGGPGGPGGQGRPGGGMQGNRPRFDMNAMKNFNPFNPKVDKSDQRSVDRAKRMNDMFSDLEKKAKGAKAAPAKSAPKKK